MRERSEGAAHGGRAGRWLLVLVVVAAVGWGLGGYPLLDPDEGRNGEVAREMMASGDYVLPRLDGLPYLDKPVLFFAADALSQQVFGVGEAAARLPALLFALATAALTGWFAGRLFDRRARWIAALAAVAAPLPIAFARTVIFDSALSFFMVLGLCAFYAAIEARHAGMAPSAGAAGQAGQAGTPGQEPVGAWGIRYLPWTALAWLAMGLGVLTKGPVALAVPLLAAVPYAIYRRASRAVWHPVGVLALAAAVGPWLWAMSRQVPEFLHYALVVETWQRVTTPQMNREGPIWLYLPVIVAGALPWSILVLAGWRRSLRLRAGIRGARLDPRLLYLFLWIALPFVMFSLSHSKRPQYILPLLPAVALLAAKVWVDSCAAGEDDEAAAANPADGDAGSVPGSRGVTLTWLGLGALCAIGAPVVARSHSAALAHVTRLPATLAAIASFFLLGSALVAWSRQAAPHGRAPLAPRALLLAGLLVPVLAMPACVVPLLDEIGANRSARAAAAAIAPRLPAGGEVVGVRAFPPSLPFYLQHTVLVASPRGRELTSNYVIAYFQKWLTADPGQTPLRPFAWWRTALAACDRPRIFVAWADDADARTTLAAAGLPRIFANDRMAAFGPCAPHSAAAKTPAADAAKAQTAE
jgi:4-amino-4-deoxy-L-arabinose transferase-like glycosyltransferase